jgi:hypothetical protein
MAIRVEPPTKEGYIEALKSAADEIKNRAEELVGEIDFVKGIAITINVNPFEVSTIVAAKTIQTPVSVVGGYTHTEVENHG